MTQVDVLKFLQKNKEKWFSTTEISEKLKVGGASININLKKLFNQGLILKVERHNLKGAYLWMLK